MSTLDFQIEWYHAAPTLQVIGRYLKERCIVEFQNGLIEEEQIAVSLLSHVLATGVERSWRHDSQNPHGEERLGTHVDVEPFVSSGGTRRIVVVRCRPFHLIHRPSSKMMAAILLRLRLVE